MAGKPSESASATAIGPSSTVVAESERTWVISAAAVNITSRIGSVGQSWTSGSRRSEEHTSELQSLMRISYAVFCLKKKKTKKHKKANKQKSKNTNINTIVNE